MTRLTCTSSEPDAMSADEYEALASVAAGRYLTVLTDLDTKDLANPGAEQIVAAATPQPGQGAVVMMHDGGDRTQTLAAVESMLTDLGKRGYAFSTVSEALGLQSSAAPVQTGARLRGEAALNTGIARALGELIVLVDGDTIFEPDAVGRLVQPFADPEVGGVSGNTKVANRRGLLGRWQHLEYVVGFNLDRRLYDLGECMPTVPGAIGAFRREVLDAVGGVPAATRRGLVYLVLFQILLPLTAPAVEVYAIYGLLFLPLPQVAGVWLSYTAVQLLAAGYALRLDRERLRPLWSLPLQLIVYRQLMYLVTVQSTVTALTGSRLRWQTVTRTGDAGQLLADSGPPTSDGPPPARSPQPASWHHGT